jgi:hypothetical protein
MAVHNSWVLQRQRDRMWLELAKATLWASANKERNYAV